MYAEEKKKGFIIYQPKLLVRFEAQVQSVLFFKDGICVKFNLFIYFAEKKGTIDKKQTWIKLSKQGPQYVSNVYAL